MANNLPPEANKFHAGNGDDGKHYWLTPPDQHADAVLQRLRDFQQFQREHPERMKYPDTASATRAPKE